MPRGIYKRTEEHKKALRVPRKGSGFYYHKLNQGFQRGHPNYQTKESKRKIGEAKKGENCHFWKGGISYEPYSVNWTTTLREAIRQRDYYICQLCRRTQEEELEKCEKKLSIHHKDCDKKNCNPDNLITLCNSCHMKITNKAKNELKKKT